MEIIFLRGLGHLALQVHEVADELQTAIAQQPAPTKNIFKCWSQCTSDFFRKKSSPDILHHIFV